jgi:hypothetical protein
MGLVSEGSSTSTLLPTDEAELLLLRYEQGSARRGPPESWQKPLWESCRSLAAHSSRVLLGFCAPNAEKGILALKAWVADLGLPKGKLFGMDIEGEPVLPPQGAVYIKYNSDSGDAFINEYSGSYRGVLFTPDLSDGNFRQFGHLPLGLIAGTGSGQHPLVENR